MGSAALRSLLGDVGGPMLFHHGAGGDVGYRVLHVLLDEGAESGVIVLGGFNGGVALVGFSGRGDLRAGRDKHECTKKKKNRSGHQKIGIQSGRKGRQKRLAAAQSYSPVGGRVNVTNRVNPALNRVGPEVVSRIRFRQHGGLNAATSVVTHYDDMSNCQSVNSVR